MCAQSCPALCDPVDCSPPGSPVHGILEATILEWVTILTIVNRVYLIFPYPVDGEGLPLATSPGSVGKSSMID